MVKARGIIKRVLNKGTKCAIYNVEIVTPLENGRTTKCWINYVMFNPSIFYEEGNEIEINGYLHSNSYEKDGKKVYTTEIVAV